MIEATQIQLSVCMITLNSERTLQRCLESVKFAQEIVIIDGGSSDRTLEIARAFGCRVYQRRFTNFIEQKNAALSVASHDWVLGIDSDEIVSDELKKELIENLSQNGQSAAAFSVPIKTWYLGQWIMASGWYPMRKIRLFRKSLASWGNQSPHESIQTGHKVQELNSDLLHFSYAGLAHHWKKWSRYGNDLAEWRFARGSRTNLVALVWEPAKKFLHVFFRVRGYRDGWRGLLIAIVSCCYIAKYELRLWQLGVRAKGGDSLKTL